MENGVPQWSVPGSGGPSEPNNGLRCVCVCVEVWVWRGTCVYVCVRGWWVDAWVCVQVFIATICSCMHCYN